jgi:hypothetical protein
MRTLSRSCGKEAWQRSVIDQVVSLRVQSPQTVASVQGSAGWRADAESGVHRGPDPGHNLPRFLWSHERQPPGECPCDNEALCPAEHRPAQKQDRE